MAAAKTGTVMVPTNPTSTADEMEYILAHSEARLSVTEPQYAAPIHAVAHAARPSPA
jgi:crotonobetaine/carnitine-CoA ligase